MKHICVLIIAAVVITLSGCGGGGGGGGSKIVDTPTDKTGPTFHTCTATYDESNDTGTIITNITDTSGISSVSAVVTGNAIVTAIDFSLTSTDTYTGTYGSVPVNYGDTDVTYTVVVTAIDAKDNPSVSQTTFTVPASSGPPPPPPDIDN